MKGSTSPDDLIVKAEAERRAGNPAAAERLYRRLLDRMPGQAKALRALGDVLDAQGKAGEAALALAAASRIDADTLARGAERLIDLGHLDKAERSIARALEIDPIHGGALWALGQIHRQRGDLEAAMDAYGRIPASDPRHAAAVYVRAILSGGAPPDTPPGDQPLPTPFVVIDEFLPREVHDALLRYTFENQQAFRVSLVRPEYYRPRVRTSARIDTPEVATDAFLPRLRGVLPDILSRLNVDCGDDFTIGNEMVAHHDGDFFRPHSDVGVEGGHASKRILSYAYYYHRTPVAFRGGSLVLYDTFLRSGTFAKTRFHRIEPRDNRIVFFLSHYFHEVEEVRSESKDFRDGRFTLGGWIYAGAPEPPAPQ